MRIFRLLLYSASAVLFTKRQVDKYFAHLLGGSKSFLLLFLLRACASIIAERLSARHLILQHALGRCIFVRHALLSVTLLCPSRSIVRHAPYLAVTLYCPSRSSTHARKDGRGVTHVYARTSSRVGWTDGGGERVHARPNAWAFARALDGRRGYGETSPSTSARAIYCARHMYAHSAYT